MSTIGHYRNIETIHPFAMPNYVSGYQIQFETWHKATRWNLKILSFVIRWCGIFRLVFKDLYYCHNVVTHADSFITLLYHYTWQIKNYSLWYDYELSLFLVKVAFEGVCSFERITYYLYMRTRWLSDESIFSMWPLKSDGLYWRSWFGCRQSLISFILITTYCRKYMSLNELIRIFCICSI